MRALPSGCAKWRSAGKRACKRANSSAETVGFLKKLPAFGNTVGSGNLR